MTEKSGLLVLREETKEREMNMPVRSRRMFFAGLAASIAGEASLVWHALTAESLGAEFVAALALLIAGNCVMLADRRASRGAAF